VGYIHRFTPTASNLLQVRGFRSNADHRVSTARNDRENVSTKR
jgi:hypothetical protein